MSVPSLSPARQTLRRFALPLVAAALLSACAPTFEARVARFSALPTPPAKTFYVEPANKADIGGLEFATYANLVKTQMLANGFTEVAAPGTADVTVMLDYGVGSPQQRIQTRPGMNMGWGGGWGAPGWGGGGWGWHPYWGPGWGGGWGGAWGGGWGAPEVYSVTEYTTIMAMKMYRNADKANLFEGRAETTSRTNNLPALMPSLVRAMFTQFPGNNGETVRVRFNPNDPNAVPRVSPVR
jgi:CubicO group peptidase (beta-lactamase class C family)